MYIISACLLGTNCKYNGGNNFSPDVLQFCKEHTYIAVCPETAGGLTSPREPAEIFVCTDGSIRVCDRSGKDVTEAFERGAEICLEQVLQRAAELGEQPEGAILKARSPSCGAGEIYDGHFCHRTVSGDGLFARRLRELEIPMTTEENYKERLGE
ncbi:MAG: DUF523 domain-containing protein [Mogibacterium sp.]|nr:DUF523 domain-containing protein [Mogibacterium sp.]